MADVNDAMGHPSDEMLAAFLDGVLDEDEREHVMAHLAECDECRAFAADWGRVVAAATGEMGKTKERVGKPPVKVARDEKHHHRTESVKADIVAAIKCANCGGNVDAPDIYCRHCGAPLKAGAFQESDAGRFALYENGSLLIGILSFIISFFAHSFFWQFLIAFGAAMGLYVYFRIKREVMMDLIEALRSGDKSKEEEIMRRLRRRFKA